MTTDISSKAMLADLRISRWTARKTDKKASAEVAKNNNVQTNSGRYYKSLIEGDALTAINKVADAARAYHYRMTLPWSDAGPRVLSSLAYFDYMQTMQDFGVQFDAAVNALVQDYPLYRQEAKRLLGNLFDDADYPMPSQIPDLFGLRVRVSPLPMANDFRVELGDDVTEAVRAEIEQHTRETVQQSVNDAYQRIRKVVSAYVDRLSDPNNRFRDSLVENARDLVEVLPALNFTGDPQLTAFADELRDRLTQYEPDDLRNDPAARTKAATAARDIDARLAGLFGTPRT